MRADSYLTAQGYVVSRQRAKALIESGDVTVDGRILRKPSEEIDETCEHTVAVNDTQKYVGRGGYKLEGALDAFGIDVTGLSAIDVGASTGGFTDCLLQRGAVHVTAIDAGAGQLAKKLCEDERVRSIEHFNARELTADAVGGRVDLIVMDVSFISATYIIPRFFELLVPEGEAICLVKPQFEVGRAMLGKGGIVKDAAAHRFAIERVAESAVQSGLVPIGIIPSPIKGGDGNREFLIRLKKTERELTPIGFADIRRAVGG